MLVTINETLSLRGGDAINHTQFGHTMAHYTSSENYWLHSTIEEANDVHVAMFLMADSLSLFCCSMIYPSSFNLLSIGQSVTDQSVGSFTLPHFYICIGL